MFELRPGLLVHHCKFCGVERALDIGVDGAERLYTLAALPLESLKRMAFEQAGYSPGGHLCPACYRVHGEELERAAIEGLGAGRLRRGRGFPAVTEEERMQRRRDSARACQRRKAARRRAA